MNLSGGTTYYFGVGINLSDKAGIEFSVETVGIGAQVNIGNWSLSMNINLIGATSITAGVNKKVEKGITVTKGVSIGINTGILVGILAFIYSGDPSYIMNFQTA